MGGVFCGMSPCSDCPGKFVVVDDEVAWPFIVFNVGCFACAWWADDEGDAGFGLSPLFGGAVVVAFVVAVGAAGTEIVRVVPGAACVDGLYVVDLGGGVGAGWAVDLAAVVVSVEDLAADALPGAGVLGFGHEGD